uniref:Nodule-specific protein n=1 Tax=Astragalus sinicus TaxID=47065 RepID=Q07A27_ASTSI|nr:nodule-specific protein [Astragalus sinicus]
MAKTLKCVYAFILLFFLFHHFTSGYQFSKNSSIFEWRKPIRSEGRPKSLVQLSNPSRCLQSNEGISYCVLRWIPWFKPKKPIKKKSHEGSQCKEREDCKEYCNGLEYTEYQCNYDMKCSCWNLYLK